MRLRDEATLEPIKRSTLSDAVVEQLKDLIFGGALVPGDRIPSERELCDRLEVSRTAVREAKQTLIGMGLLESRPGDGTFVSDNTMDILSESIQRKSVLQAVCVDELLEARRIVEVGCAALAAKRIRPETESRLRELTAEMQEALDRNDLDAFAEADLAWHMAVSEAAANKVMSQMIAAVRGLLSTFIDTILTEVPDTPRIALEGHRAILHAIIRRDENNARQAMAMHIADMERLIAQYRAEMSG
jgi:GntR family transcriptional repressor for pyruvate dehydrogenase complex